MDDKAVFSKENYRLAASILLKGTPDCLTLDKSAEAFKRAGDFKEAFRVQIKAVELAKIQSKDPDFAGRVFDQTVIDYQEKADVYQKLVR